MHKVEDWSQGTTGIGQGALDLERHGGEPRPFRHRGRQAVSDRIGANRTGIRLSP